MTTETITALPASVLTKSQKKTYGPKIFKERGETYRITATVRHDDQCGNGHNSFAITGEIDRKSGNHWTDDAGGCIHEEIAKHFPDLKPFIKWHLMGTDMPMHYVANTVYLAGDRDCHGLRKGEFRQHTSRGPNQNGGVPGVPNWVLELPDRETRNVYAAAKPAPVTLEWKAYGRTGEGKERELDAARRSAVWPEATNEELTAPGLEARLMARLPALMAAFKADVEKLGLTY
jgi:hypothetical protein